MKHEFDVAIVGGGMTGASLALLLKPAIEQGLKVALIEGHAISTHDITQPSFDDRCTALSFGTQQIFEKMGVWLRVAGQACAIEHIQVSQQQQFGRIRLHAQDNHVDAMGYVLENRIMGQQLLGAILNVPALRVFAPAQVVTYQVDEKGAKLQLSQTGETIDLHAKLLVLADGANSEGCRQLGIMHTRHDYEQDALVCNVSFDKPHQNWAYERFTTQGPMALLPMTGNRFALVWCMNREQSQRYLNMDDKAFSQVLQLALGHKLGRVNRVGKRANYPLNLVVAKEQVRSNVVVLGNAAHALHPVAGQGFNLALRDAQALANHIRVHWPKQSLGNLAGLMDYLAGQTRDQKATIGLSHGLPTAFARPGTAWSMIRALGLTAMDVTPVAKKLFTRQAMGLVGSADVWQP
jgi:2-octaprenyl-6-methoxyphenol hydroxylase